MLRTPRAAMVVVMMVSVISPVTAFGQTEAGCAFGAAFRGPSQFFTDIDCSGSASTSKSELSTGSAGPQCDENNCCDWRTVDEPTDSDRWAGRSPSEGSFVGTYCYAKENDGTGLGGLVSIDFAQFAVAVPPPPSPAELAQRASDQIFVPIPAIGAGPDRSKLAVNLWTWLWIDGAGPIEATAAAGGISVTATATLTSVTWSLGEPAATGGPYAPGPAVTITCQGSGAAPAWDYDWKAKPPCGHQYAWMSSKDRTGGTGKWPISATSNWTVNWQSNTGVSGSGTLNATGNDALEIGEYRVVLVHGNGG